MSTGTTQVSQVSVPDQLRHDDDVFPIVKLCESECGPVKTAAWISQNQDELLAQAFRHGAVLFRNFGIATPEDFDQFISAFDLENFPYQKSLSNAVRVNFTERVFSANEAPPDVKIFLHHEMAQTPIFPRRLFFFCRQAAESGGATPLCRSDWLMELIEDQLPTFAADCAAKGLRYTNVMPAVDDPESGMGRSWQSTLRAESKEQAEARLRELGYSWEWLDGDSLKATTPTLPAVKQLDDGRRVFFNQLIAAFRGWKDSRNDPSKAITFGDASPMDRDTVLKVADLAEEVTFDLPWQTGDVALVDNVVAMHGRRTFTGTRKVLASLVSAQANEMDRPTQSVQPNGTNA